MQSFRILICFKRCNVCMSVRARICVWMQVCSEHYTCLSAYVYARSWGRQGGGGRMWKWDTYIYILHFIVIFNVPSWVFETMCQRIFFSFLCFVYWWIIKIYLIDWLTDLIDQHSCTRKNCSVDQGQPSHWDASDLNTKWTHNPPLWLWEHDIDLQPCT